MRMRNEDRKRAQRTPVVAQPCSLSALNVKAEAEELRLNWYAHRWAAAYIIITVAALLLLSVICYIWAQIRV